MNQHRFNRTGGEPNRATAPGREPERWDGGPRRLIPMNDVTRILAAINQGQPELAAELLPLVYNELRCLAARKLAQEKPGQTLQATALVHEAYLRLVASQAARPWDGRGHFFAAAAEAMRRILVERARRRRREKHGGALVRVELDEAELAGRMPPEDLLALDEALARLAAEDPLKARLVELRFFAGLSLQEAAECLGVSAVTGKRYWRYAKAWLHRELADDGDRGAPRGHGQESSPPR